MSNKQEQAAARIADKYVARDGDAPAGEAALKPNQAHAHNIAVVGKFIAAHSMRDVWGGRTADEAMWALADLAGVNAGELWATFKPFGKIT